MRRCPTCGGMYDHASDSICRGHQVADGVNGTADSGDQVVDPEERIYRGPKEHRPKGWNSTISPPADELTDEQVVQLRGYISDVAKARTHWLIPFAGLLGKTSLDLVEDLIGDELHVMTLRLPDDVGVWLALVPKSELSEDDLQARIRQRWGWGDEELFDNVDTGGDIIALPERAEWADKHPGLYAAVVIVVTRALQEWCLSGRILQPRFQKGLVVSLV